MARLYPLLLALALLASGCTRAYTVTMGAQPSSSAHYVVVKTRGNGKLKVFDCQSQPDGSTWDPTCKQVRMQSQMGETLDETWSRIRKKD